MKITFNNDEIDDLLEALDRYFTLDCEDAIAQYNKIVKKFENARSRSKASKSKIHFIEHAEWKKKCEERAEIQRDVLKSYHESMKKESVE